MSSVQELLTLLDNTSKKSKKQKKEKPKKLKKEKLDKKKLKKKNKQLLKHYSEFCESGVCTQMPEVKKKKKKKIKHSLNEEFSLPVDFLLPKSKLPKPFKKHKSSNTETCKVVGIAHPGPAKLKATSAKTDKKFIQTNKKKNKKRVKFSLSPALIEQPRTAKLLSPKPAFFTSGLLNKRCLEENLSQTSSDDINSQDLFITQKSQNVSDPYIDICSSTSVEETDPQQLSHRSLLRHKMSKHTFEASTQTENFFTSPMPTTSNRLNGLIVCTEQPLDLSMAKISRATHPQFPGTDVTSSDDSDTTAKSKSDVSQIKVVQTRLNECFFFKLRGDVDSPKPRSPLMKFTKSVDKKKL